MPRKIALKETSKGQKKNTAKKVSKLVSYSRAAESQQLKSSSQALDNMDTAVSIERKPEGARTVKVHKLSLIIAFFIILAGVLLYFGRSYIVAVVVNGQPISRLALVQESEKASGKQALASLIRNALVEQEASKKKVAVNDKEIDEQIKKIESNLSKQGQKLDQMLTLEGLTRNDLRKMVRLDILVTKLVGKDVKISDKDVADYIEKNQDVLPKDQKESQIKKDVAEVLKRQQISQKAQNWLVELEKNANIQRFVNY